MIRTRRAGAAIVGVVARVGVCVSVEVGARVAVSAIVGGTVAVAVVNVIGATPTSGKRQAASRDAKIRKTNIRVRGDFI